MRRHEDGFTLIELLIAIVVVVTITATLGQAVVIGLQTTAAAEDVLLGGNDGRALATALIPDIQNATTISTTDTSCGGAGTALALSWEDGQTIRAAWVVRTVSSFAQLVRVSCVGSGTPTEMVVVHSLATTNSFVVTCTGGTSTLTAVANQASVGPLSVTATSRANGVCP